MGIPYSKEINRAFEELNKAYGQVTPLIEAAYEVLQTTKNISLLLAAIQVLTVVLLAAILLVLMGIVISVNPELERERKEVVTPVVRWCVGWVGLVKMGMTAGGVVLMSGMVLYVAVKYGLGPFAAGRRQEDELDDESDEEDEEGGDDKEEDQDGKEGDEGKETGDGGEEDDGGERLHIAEGDPVKEGKKKKKEKKKEGKEGGGSWCIVM